MPNVKDLIERAKARAAGNSLALGLVTELADALERLTQPVGVEPISKEFQGRDGKWYPFIDERHYINTANDGSWPIRDLYSAETVARLQAERDEAQSCALDTLSKFNKAIIERDALQEQVKMLRAPLIDTLDFVERHSNRWNGVNGKHPNDVVTAAREALAATEQKEKAE